MCYTCRTGKPHTAGLLATRLCACTSTGGVISHSASVEDEDEDENVASEVWGHGRLFRRQKTRVHAAGQAAVDCAEVRIGKALKMQALHHVLERHPQVRHLDFGDQKAVRNAFNAFKGNPPPWSSADEARRAGWG